MSAARLSADLLAEATAGGCTFLAEQAVQGRLLGASAPLRRLAWAHLFGVISGSNPEDWVVALDAERSKYNLLVNEHKKENNVKALDPNLCNPLARRLDNPFNKVQANDELHREIWKDVERTFPEVELLASPESRKMLSRLLFHYCRSTNAPGQAASECYRQGMNELAAVLLAACKRGEFAEGSWETGDSLGARLCGMQHTEADSFTLFSRLMKSGMRPMFMPTSFGGGNSDSGPGSVIGELPRSRLSGGLRDTAPASAILARCLFIFDTVVKASDAALHSHLTKLEIEPQVFLLRWLRLLFCREVGLDDALLLWDGLFADAIKQPQVPSALKYPLLRSGGGDVAWREAAQASAAMPLVDYVAAASLRSMRGDLIGLDQTDCLRRLMTPRPPACGVMALLDTARRLRKSAHSLPHPQPLAAPPAAARGPRDAAASGGRAPAPGESGAAGFPPRGQQLLGAAAQAAQGLFGAVSQSVQRLSEQLDAVPGAGGDASVAQDWRSRALQAELERDNIKKKANEFVITKRAEFAAQLTDLRLQVEEKDVQLAERDARIAALEAQLCAASSGRPAVGGGAGDLRLDQDLGDGLLD